MGTHLFGAGFGAAILVLSNLIMSSALDHQLTYVFLVHHVNDGRVLERGFALSPVQTWFETHFSLASVPGATCASPVCYNSTSSSYPSLTCPFEFYSDGRPMRGAFQLASHAARQVSAFRNQNPAQYSVMQRTLIRELMRLQPHAKQELDRRHQAVLSKFKYNQQIALHVRRTDKLRKEAKLVNCTVFVAALDMVLDHQPGQQYGVLVHLMTDDAAVEHEFAQAWRNSRHFSRVTVNFRFSGGKQPSELDAAGVVNEAMYWLMVDFRLMIAADGFIGSQTSNMGVVACTLRAHVGCYTVEQPAPFYWNATRNKLT